MSWGWAVRNLNRATSWVARSRRRHGRREVREAAHLFPMTRYRMRPSPAARLAWLTVPGLAVAVAGSARLPGRAGGLTSTFVVVLLVIGCLLTLNAAVARVPLWLRITGVICGLAYPVLAILAATGVV